MSYRRRRNALNADFADETDPLARFDRAYRYARSALASARSRDYPIASGPGRTAVAAATRALVGLGDQLLKPGHE